MGLFVPTRSWIAFAALWAAGIFATGPGRAQEIPVYLQMANMTALVSTPDGRRSNTPVTVFVQVGSVREASEICRRVPVMRSAILSATSQRPIPYATGRLDSDSVAVFVTDFVNAQLGEKIIARVGFVHGTPKEETSSTTDLADPGDLTAGDRTVKSGKAGQMAPCRRIVAPPTGLKWVDTKSKPGSAQTVAPSTPLLRGPAPPPPPPRGEFQSHPQFAPSAAPESERPAAPISIVGMSEKARADKPSSAGNCMPIDKIWEPNRFPYAGALYALSRVFTIDANGDGRPDNIGFVFNAPGQPDVVLRYIDDPGRAAIDLFPSLTIKESLSVDRICFGQHDFHASGSAQSPKTATPIGIDILQSSSSSQPMVQAKGFGFWALILVITFALMGAMSATIILVRRRGARAAMARRDTEEEEDDREGPDRRRKERRKKSVPVKADRRSSGDRREK